MAKQLSKNLTPSVVANLPLAKSCRDTYYVWDKRERMFGVRVGSKRRTFVVKAGSKSNCYSVGHYPVLTPEEARKKARDTRDEAIGTGVVKIEPTLEAAIDDYVNSRIADGKMSPATEKNYIVSLKHHLKDWMTRRVDQISRDEILHRHKELTTKRWMICSDGKKREQGGKVLADGIMKLLSTVIRFSTDKPNPVSVLSDRKRWHNAKKRGKAISQIDLPAVYEGIMKMSSVRLERYSKLMPMGELGQDFLLLCLYTGLRSIEARSLEWGNVDWENRTIRIPAEVAKNRQELILPFTHQLEAILLNRKFHRDNSGMGLQNPRYAYVFPSAVCSGKKAYMDSAGYHYEKASKLSGVQFTTHTLRHTFVTQAERADITYAKQKYLVNHRPQDITQHYQHLEVDDVREAAQLVADQIDRAAGSVKE